MGGPGSGTWYRWNKTTKVKECIRLDIRDFKKRNALIPGPPRSWSWKDNHGRDSGSIQVHVVNQFTMAISCAFNAEPRSERIALTTTPCNYGGERFWFRCPGCNSRVGVLASVNGWFRCRKCHSLGYESENHTSLDRMISRRDKVRAKLDNGKQMHKKTRQRLQNEWALLEMRCDEMINQELIKRCRQYGFESI